MKAIIISILFTNVFVINLYTQQPNFFPINIGNEYQFKSRYNQEYYFGKIERDTTYSNMIKYFVTPYFFEFGDCRVDSFGNIYSISRPFFLAEPPLEYLLFKADAQFDEVWVICDSINVLNHKGYGKCVYLENKFIFGKTRTVKGIRLYSDSYYYYYFWLADGIGLIRNQYDDGSGLDLNYAKIDGNIYGTLVSVENDISSLPQEFSVTQNFPNPFNNTTNIDVFLPTQLKSNFIKFSVYNILGIKVFEQEFPAAINVNIKINTDQLNLSSGTYFYSVLYVSKSITKKFLLIK